MPGLDGMAAAELIRKESSSLAPIVLMMTSTSERPDPERCARLGVIEYLTKPIRPRDLAAAISLATQSAHQARPRLASTHEAPVHPKRPPLSILVAEDNAVNQTLAERLLEKEGHRPTIVGTGKEALAELERASFDLVLMDVQMPEMDGLEAIAIIRQREEQSGGAVHLPIIAMTAFVMQSDKERFFAAGFDGFVRKPVHIDELFAEIDRLLPVPSRNQPELESETPSRSVCSPGAPFDKAQALSRVGGDEELLRELIGVFLEECPRWLADVRAALAAGDAQKLRRAAHTIKGAVDNCGAGSAFESALRLERIGGEGRLAEADEAFASLEAELARLEPALAVYAANA